MTRTSLIIFLFTLLTIDCAILRRRSQTEVGQGYTIGAVSSQKGLIDLFYINRNYGITQYSFNKSWTGTDLTTILAPTFLHTGIAASAFNASRLDLFITSQNNEVFHTFYDQTQRNNLNGGWQPWDSIGGNVSYYPAAVTRGKSLDVVVVGNNKAVYYKFWNFVWSNWLNIGGVAASAPAITAWDDKRLDIFIRSPKDELMHKFWSKNLGWSEWKNRSGEGVIKSAPAVVSSSVKKLDVFALASTGEMLHLAFNGEQWSAWKTLGGVLTSAPSAVSQDEDKITVYARNQDRVLVDNRWDGKKWSGWNTVAGGAIVIPDQ